MDINIENYTNIENVSIAEFKEVLANTEERALSELSKGNFKESARYGVLYIKLNNLFYQKISQVNKYGYNKKGNSK